MSSDDAPMRISTDNLDDLLVNVHVDDLSFWDADPFAHDIGAATVRNAAFGHVRIPLVHDGEVLWGGALVEAERMEPRDDGRIRVLDLSAAGWSRERAIAAALGEITAERTAVADDVSLAELLIEIREHDETLTSAAGWDGDDIDALLEQIERDAADLDLDEDEEEAAVPPLPVEPVTKRGDVWILGKHRVMCGDCRDADDVSTLLAGEDINMAFTSPPYADRRTYDETTEFKPIRPDEYAEWFDQVQANVADNIAPDGSWFVNIKEHCTDGQRELYVKDLTLTHVREWGWMLVDELCWHRAGVPGGWNNRFKNDWEPVFHFARPGRPIKFRPENVMHPSTGVFTYDPNAPKSGSGSGLLGEHEHQEGMARPGNLIAVTTGGDRTSSDHPAAFPVALPEFFVKAYTDEDDTVFDPFMGSGSTLLAVDQNDRVAYGMEISPGYCDVICARFQRQTGIKPTLEATGEPHDFTEDDDA